MQDAPDTHRFHETRWSVVQRAKGAGDDAKLALGQLCESSYRPVYSFIVRWCGDSERARDLTQDFFCRLLAQPRLDSVDQTRGRFRSFLLGAVKHFLCNAQDKVRALKRGGGVVQVPLPEGGDEYDGGPGLPDLKNLPPDAAFDRQWALALLERSMGTLEQSLQKEGKPGHFAALKPWLVGAQDASTLGQTAVQLGMNESALRVALHRLRQRFRDQVRREVAQTLDPSADVEQELQHLRQALQG